jgi:hypothetical protein
MVATAAKKKAPTTTRVVIQPPKFEYIKLGIIGTAPLVQHKFSKKVGAQMLADQMREGAKSRKRPSRKPEEEVIEATHISSEGWYGIPAAAFRSAMVSACRLCGFQMTKAKLSVFVEADGYDDEGTPLVRLIGGAPETRTDRVRLDNGTATIAIRPMWRQWAANVLFQYDGDQFNASDVTNLLMRVGVQVGVLEGRPDSKKSNGCGWGTFRLANENEMGDLNKLTPINGRRRVAKKKVAKKKVAKKKVAKKKTRRVA